MIKKKLICFGTCQWEADNLTCKVMMVMRALGYYLSSAILVTLSIDRYGMIWGGEKRATLTILTQVSGGQEPFQDSSLWQAEEAGQGDGVVLLGGVLHPLLAPGHHVQEAEASSS